MATTIPPDGYCDARERDRATGGGHRDGNCLFASSPGRELVAESIDDEQRIVDGERQPDQGHDVGRVLGNVGEARQQHRPGQPADDREQADSQREEGGDDRGEDEDEHQKCDRKGDVFGPHEVRVEGRVEGKVEWNLTRGDDGERSWVDRGNHLVDVPLRRPGLVFELHHDQRLVPVSRHEGRLLARGHAVRSCQTGDPGIASERRDRAFHGGLELGVRDLEGRAAEDQRHARSHDDRLVPVDVASYQAGGASGFQARSETLVSDNLSACEDADHGSPEEHR